MKKKLIAVGASIFILCISVISCQKFESSNENNIKQENVKQISEQNRSMSAGDIHNALINVYIDRYGFIINSVVTLEDSDTLVKRLATLGIENGLLNTDLSMDSIVNMINDMNNEIPLVTNNTDLRAVSELSDHVINKIENPIIKTTLSESISLLLSNDPNSLSQALTELNNLTDLTTEEQIIVNDFSSILSSSYHLWQNQLPVTTNIGGIAGADGLGAIRGAQYAAEHNLTGGARDMIVNLTATYYSMMYAQ